MSSGKHASIFCCFRRAVINGKKIYISTKEKSWKSSSCSKVFNSQLLMHRVFFWSISECLKPFLIVVFESINCPQCEKMDLKIIQSLLERVQICKNAGKLDLSEEQCSVQLFRTNRDSWTTNTKQKNVVDHPGNLTQY